MEPHSHILVLQACLGSALFSIVTPHSCYVDAGNQSWTQLFKKANIALSVPSGLTSTQVHYITENCEPSLYIA